MEQTKVCGDCNQSKQTSFFNQKSKICKDCQKIYNKNYRLMNSIAIKEKRHESYLKNSDQIKQNSRSYTKNNKEKISVNKKLYYFDNKEEILFYIKEYFFHQYRTNDLFRLKNNLRTRLNGALRSSNWKKISSLSEYLGCSIAKLKIYLENKFQPGMSWKNKGRNGWHIDHIIPLSSANTVEELFKLCHYTNLQPLWEMDNFRKSNTYGR